MISILLLSSCEKETEDKGCVKSIAFATSNSFVGVTGSITEAAKYKYLVISETPNVSEVNGKVYCDTMASSQNFSFKILRLYANTKYYVRIFYHDANDKAFYSTEYTVTTANSTIATEFSPVVKVDTLINGNACNLLMYSFKMISDLRNAEFGFCYSKTSDPTVSSSLVRGTLNEKGVVSCNMTVINDYDSVTVRPYFKTSKGVDYGAAFKYAKSSWVKCGLFPGLRNIDHGAITYKGKSYIFLGCAYNKENGKEGSEDMWSFNPTTLAWTKEVSLEKIISTSGGWCTINMKAAPLSNGFLFFKGEDYSGRVYNRFFTYNIVDKTYTQILPNGIPDNVYKYSWGCDGFSIGGQPYVAMYLGSSSIQNESAGAILYKYNESSRTFEQETANTNRHGVRNVVCFTLGDVVYMGAGSYSGFSTTHTTDFWSYNVKMKIWTQLKDAPISKFKKSFVYKNRCFVIGYDDSKLYEYIVDVDTWKVIGKLPTSVQSVMPFGDGLYLFNGDSVWKSIAL